MVACGKAEVTAHVPESEFSSEISSDEKVIAETIEDRDRVHIFSDNPEEISVGEDGKTITISLKGNATTSYEWKAEMYEKGILEELSAEYLPNENKEGLAGTGGTWIAKYKVKGNGRATILANYSRSWEKDPIESRQVTVTVTDGKITDVENVVFEIEPSEEEETTAAEIVSETCEETETHETEAASIAPIPEKTVFIPEEENDMGCLDDGLTW